MLEPTDVGETEYYRCRVELRFRAVGLCRDRWTTSHSPLSEDWHVFHSVISDIWYPNRIGYRDLAARV